MRHAQPVAAGMRFLSDLTSVWAQETMPNSLEPVDYPSTMKPTVPRPVHAANQAARCPPPIPLSHLPPAKRHMAQYQAS